MILDALANGYDAGHLGFRIILACLTGFRLQIPVSFQAPDNTRFRIYTALAEGKKKPRITGLFSKVRVLTTLLRALHHGIQGNQLPYQALFHRAPGQ